MSLITPHYLLVGGCSKDKVLQAHKKAREIFKTNNKINKLISPLKSDSFFILYDSSHHRWKNEDEYMKAKTAYIQYLVESDIQFVEMATQELISWKHAKGPKKLEQHIYHVERKKRRIINQLIDWGISRGSTLFR
jgi:hypothetical protein